ncbi:hypothetical protein SOMG_00826 [Schizosaccharomyces osmophilus]|uniref:Uncharacterized protein n=1 Tax=Schizosaccharomyces osmophilus TaxID=2545709 RepID=A0AAF0AVX8_9SCHI|nr:uncharacterized protein SOMG_00826 [Schizosaccharomyces osmophilus]WBW72947.1 hypothetical protein SOMG_00826 [Schizosaccharomyces osmophilus]
MGYGLPDKYVFRDIRGTTKGQFGFSLSDKAKAPLWETETDNQQRTNNPFVLDEVQKLEMEMET